MRHEQETLVQQAGADSLAGKTPLEIVHAGKDLIETASAEMRNQIDQAAELYVANYLARDDSPELFDGCVELVRNYSVLNMSDAEWRAGIPDVDGNYTQPDTAGQYRLREDIHLLVDPSPDLGTPDIDPADLSPELAVLQGNLEVARTQLAELSIKRRAMIRKKGSKASTLSTQYETAQGQYDEALKAMGVHAVEDLRANGYSADEVTQMVIMGTIAERQAFTEAEAETMAMDNSKLAKMMRWYGKLPVMIGANTIVGGAIGMAAGKVVKYGFLAAMPVAGISGLAAVRTGKALLTSSLNNRVRLHKELDKRGAKDIANLQDFINSDEVGVQVDEDVDAEYYAELSQKLVSQSIDKRVEKDIKGNRTRVAVSAAIAGSVALAGALYASDKIHNPFAGKSHPTHGGGLTDQTLKSAGVVDPNERANILAHPDDFKHMISHPADFEKFTRGVDHIKQSTHLTGDALNERVGKTLHLADYLDKHPMATGAGLKSLPLDGGGSATRSGVEGVSGIGEVVNVARGGGVIRSVIRPLADTQGVHLTKGQETNIWQAVRSSFGDNIFTDMPVKSHGADQWIARSGQAHLRPAVSEFIQQKLKTA